MPGFIAIDVVTMCFDRHSSAILWLFANLKLFEKYFGCEYLY